MSLTNFQSYLQFHLEVEEQEIQFILDNCHVRTVEKEEILLRAGEFCKSVFFVESGLLRQYSIDEKGKEHILNFAPENWFLSDRESNFFNLPAGYYIQAWETSRIMQLDVAFWDQLGGKFPKFAEFNTRLLHNHIRHLQNRINSLLSAPAETRYLDFIKMYPDILQRVPQWMVASYLGITPESLSRVRRELVQKKFN